MVVGLEEHVSRAPLSAQPLLRVHIHFRLPLLRTQHKISTIHHTPRASAGRRTHRSRPALLKRIALGLLSSSVGCAGAMAGEAGAEDLGEGWDELRLARDQRADVDHGLVGGDVGAGALGQRGVGFGERAVGEGVPGERKLPPAAHEEHRALLRNVHHEQEREVQLPPHVPPEVVRAVVLGGNGSWARAEG